MTEMKTIEYHSHERIDGISIGVLMQISNEVPMVVFPQNLVSKAIPARSIVSLDGADIGHEVALSFESGNPERPIILGKITKPSHDAAPVGNTEVEIDGQSENLDLTAQKRITLRCGKASITLTREGKVLIKGAYVSSRSTGQNRIKGGSVHLN